MSSVYLILLWWSWECVLYLIIIIKPEVWIVNYCLGLGHESMVCVVCSFLDLCLLDCYLCNACFLLRWWVSMKFIWCPSFLVTTTVFKKMRRMRQLLTTLWSYHDRWMEKLSYFSHMFLMFPHQSDWLVIPIRHDLRLRLRQTYRELVTVYPVVWDDWLRSSCTS